ncbi:WXG100 family type VII secretion target [Streptomyces sp. NPDC002911]
MPAAEDGIFIEHQRAQMFVEEMAAFTTRLDAVVSELESQLAPIVTTWLGADRQVYDTVQLAWNNKVNELRLALSSHAQTLSGVSSNYHRTNLANAQSFESITI